jgi:dolichyl-phosphate beta-glucosyltransferase
MLVYLQNGRLKAFFMIIAVDRLKELIQKNFTVVVKYSVIGVMGTIIDIGGLFVLVNYFRFPVLAAATISFLLAVTNNYVFNKNWTFKSRSTNNRKLFIKFLIVHVIGLSINLSGIFVLVNLLGVWYIFAKIFITFFVLIWNFLANKLWTFRTKDQKNVNLNNDLFLSIVIPAFNEEKRIAETLTKIKNYLSRKNLLAEIIIVNDGSKDKTDEVVGAFVGENVKLISLVKNHGKGFAIKKGIEGAKGKYVLFTDADNSTPIEEFDKFLDIINNDINNFDVLIGSRYLNINSVLIKQSKYRIVISRLGNFFIQLFLLDGIKDTQCGFKLFKTVIAKDIFSFQKVRRFDIEVIVVAKNLGYKFVEVPVSWMNVGGSRLRPIKDVLITAKDLIYIKLNLWAGRYNHD